MASLENLKLDSVTKRKAPATPESVHVANEGLKGNLVLFTPTQLFAEYLATKLRKLPPEESSDSPHCCRVIVRLPYGRRVERIFSKQQTVQVDNLQGHDLTSSEPL